MNCETRRKAIGLNIHTLAQEAGVVSSSVSRLEAGGNCLLNTRRKILEALKRLEAEHKELGHIGGPRKTNICQARRRPDIARARKTLGMTQSALAEQWKTTKHEISKIESGYDTPDRVLEEMVDGQLRAMMKERGLAWPGEDRLQVDGTGTANWAARELAQGTFKTGAAERLAKAIFPPGPTEQDVQNWIASEHQKFMPASKVGAPIPFTQAPCPRCDRGILWGPDGKPYKCPLCEGRTP